MRALACVFLIACGGGDTDEVKGDPLIVSSLMAELDNKVWMPAYGFGRTEGPKFGLHLGSAEISCADDFEDARDGTHASISVAGAPAVGTTTSITLDVTDIVDGKVAMRAVEGTLQITRVTETDVSAVYGFDTSSDGKRTAINGAVTMLRCR
ncbi:MAG TPA: hypothetical protein VK427_21310 [Kofleriaceae bacterium]|nr:hypothetical protein [Kofleriaceae bacterium]